MLVSSCKGRPAEDTLKVQCGSCMIISYMMCTNCTDENLR